MTRELYVGTLVQLPSGDPAPNLPFTVWSDRAGGIDLTASLVAPDGVSAYNPVTSGQGLLADFRGPDGYGGFGVWVDTSVGQRFLLPSPTMVNELADTVAQLLVSGVGTGGGGGLPAGTTLEQIPNGTTRLAFTQAERDRLATMATNATALTIGTTATTAKAGNYQPTPAQIGAVQNVVGFGRIWGRTAAQGIPTVAEGLQEGDYIAITGTA